MSRDNRGDRSKVYVGHLNPRTRERDLYDIFERFGPIYKICGGATECSRGHRIELKHCYAFIDYENRRDAEDAIYDMDGRDIDGERITVEWTRGLNRKRGRGFRPERSDYRIRIENLPDHAHWQDLKDHFRRAGDVIYGDINGNTGVLEFRYPEDVDRAIRQFHKSRWNGFTLYIEEDGPRRRGRDGRRKRSRSRSDSRSRSRSRTRSRSRSRKRRSGSSRSKSKSRSPDRRKHRSRSKSRSRSRSSDRRKYRSRSKSRSNDKKRSRSRTKSPDRRKTYRRKSGSRSKSTERRKSGSKSRPERSKSRSEERRSHGSRSRSGSLGKSHEKSREKSQEKSREKSEEKSREKSREKSAEKTSPRASRSRSNSRSKSPSREKSRSPGFSGENFSENPADTDDRI